MAYNMKNGRELRDELGVEGHILMIKAKTRAEWIAQARKALSDAEKYGATCPNKMRAEEKDKLREALTVLGQKCDF